MKQWPPLLKIVEQTTVTENETHYFTASKAIIDSGEDHQ